MNKLFTRKIFVLLFCLSIFTLASCAKKDMLSLWNDQSLSKQTLVSYVESVTKKGSADFIPLERRIAVFDVDGTLFGETDPIYFDWIMYTYRVLEDESYKNRATEEEIALAKEIKEAMATRKIPAGMEEAHARLMPQLFKGMTVEEFKDYVRAFMELPAPGYNNMKRGEAFYEPMKQVVNYLLANDFTVYLCSGTDRITVRTLAESVFPLPPRQIIGTDNTLVASGQNGADGLEYVFTKDDVVTLGGNFIVKNVKMNKVSVIAQEIGVQPVLCFGNSFGDESMANYVVNKNEYKSASFMLLCDDTVREYGKPEAAEKMKNACAQNGWGPVSMRDDWKTIYAEKITRK